MRKLLILIVFLNWSNNLYALNIKQTKVYLSGHGGFSSPAAIKFENDDEIKRITNHILRGAILSIQPVQYTSLDITWSWFSEYNVSRQSVSNPIFRGEKYKTKLIDMTLKTVLYPLTSSVSVCVKYGFWGLHNLRLVERKVTESSSVWGYGVVLGPSVNWVLAPHTYPTFSIEGAILCYFTVPHLPGLPKNYVPYKFPLGRLSANWHVW